MKNLVDKVNTRWFWPVLIFIAALATVLSLWIGMHQSVWFDEAYSIMVAKQPIGEAIRLAGVDTHPPLYYIILHWWGEAFNWNVLALRILSVASFGGAILVAAALMRRMFGIRAALCTAATIAIAPLLVRYGFEIRMYSLASLIGVTATYFMFRAREAKGRQQVIFCAMYAALVTAGMYTLYYLAFLWLAHLAWLVCMAKREGKLVKLHKQPWAWVYAASVVPFLPWLPTFLKQMNNGALAPIGQQMNLENIVGVVTFNSLYRPLWQVDIWLSFLSLALFGSVVYIARTALKNVSKKRERNYLLLLAMYIGIPIFVLMLLSFSRSMYVERYLSHVAIGLIMLVAGLIAISLRTPTKKLYVAIAIVASTLVVGIVNVSNIGNFNFQRMSRPEVNVAAVDLGKCDSDMTIIAADPYVYIELAAYLPSSCDLRFYNEWDHLGGGYAPLDSSSKQFRTKSITGSDRLYYVYYDQPRLTVESHYYMTGQDFYGNLNVTRYTRYPSVE
jgi:uncharacterized membrane protein